MSETLPFEIRYKYPHLKPKDVEIWERFIHKFPNAYKFVRYDVNVGDPPPFNPLLDDGTDINQDTLYKLKIDVIGINENTMDIIEIKPGAGPSAIGQIKGYKTLFVRDEKPKTEIGMIIITDKIQPNMEFLAQEEKVKLILV